MKIKIKEEKKTPSSQKQKHNVISILKYFNERNVCEHTLDYSKRQTSFIDRPDTSKSESKKQF